jgi:cell division protease FtsH
MAELSVALAGQLAEELTFREVSTGAANDLQNATHVARQLVTRYGMSKLGQRTFGETEEMIFLGREIHEQRNYSDKVAQEIDAEIDRLLKHARQTAEKILRERKDDLTKVAAVLLEKETIERDDFEHLLGPKPANRRPGRAASVVREMA